MYLSCIFRQNPAIQNIDAYFRLAECYRNANDRPCQRTLLHIGFLTLNGEPRSKIQRQLNARAEGKGELFVEEDPLVREQVERLWRELIEKKRIDPPEIAREKKKKLLDVDTLAHKDVREIGTEWMCYQAAEQLKNKRVFTKPPMVRGADTISSYANYLSCRLPRFRIKNGATHSIPLGHL